MINIRSNNKKYPMFAMCSLYPKNERMMCACFLGRDHDIVEKMSNLHVDALFWAGLGSGVISLSNLEEEMYGKRRWDTNGRCDADYIKDCLDHGIIAFGTVFTGQAYELGIEIDKDKTKCLSFGKFEGKGKKSWWGLQEFYQNKYPKIFKGWNSYFQKKFVDEDGKEIKNLINEISCKDAEGRFLKSYWVNEPSKYFDMTIYTPCKNSPYWRDYIKKIIEMQIEAGVGGILFDEPFDPSYTYGGCFCKHCMKKFSAYLTRIHGKQFQNFDYARFFKNKGHGLISSLIYYHNEPYWREFRLFHLDSLIDSFTEFVKYVKDTGRKKSKNILTAGNFSLVWPCFFPLVDLVDVFNLEIELDLPPNNVRFLYQLARVLVGNKPISAVSSIMLASYLREQEKKNLGITGNVMKYFIAEAAASQGNYEIPYSCFTLDSPGAYYPPLEPIYQYQDFLYNNQECFEYSTLKPLSNINLICSWPSYFWTFNFLSMYGSHVLSLNGISNLLDDLFVPYSMAIFGDGKYIPLYINQAFEKSYLILPNVVCLSEKNIKDIKNFAINGGIVIICGSFGKFDNFYNERKRRFIDELNDGWNSFEKGGLYKIPFDIGREYKSQKRLDDKKIFKKVLEKINYKSPLETNSKENLLILPYINDELLIIHILNRQYQKDIGEFIPLKEQIISISSPISIAEGEFLFPEGTIQDIEFQEQDKNVILKVPEISLYGIIKLKGGKP